MENYNNERFQSISQQQNQGNDNRMRLNSFLLNRFNSANSSVASTSSASAVTSTNELSSIKRNLFGIRLNHEQLKEDLKEMWKEQIEIQKYKWNFDFEKLKPTSSKQTASASSALNRFKWTRVNTKTQSYPNVDEMQISAFNQDELVFMLKKKERNQATNDMMDDEETDEEEEEEDEALAIPQFYKYQRKMKLNENQHIKRLNEEKKKKLSEEMNNLLMNKKKLQQQISAQQTSNKKNVKTAKPSAIRKTNKVTLNKITQSQQPSSNSIHANQTAEQSCSSALIRKPKPVKRMNQTSLILSPSTQNLIITFSENRKDTLRSAVHNHNLARSCNSAFETAKQDSQMATSSTASNDNMKQQTLLDLFKQRKKRAIMNAPSQLKNTHNLRSHNNNHLTSTSSSLYR